MRKNVAKLLIAVMAMLSVSTNAAAADPCTHQWSSWTTAQAATCTKTKPSLQQTYTSGAIGR